MTQNHILTTRPLIPADFEAWLPLWNAYLGQNTAKMRWGDRVALFRKLAHQADTVPESVANVAAGLVVECDGKIVGIAHYQIHIAPFTFENAYIVQDLYVMPDYQAKRAGTALVRALYQASRENGVPAVYWMAAENIYRGGDSAAVTSPFLQYRKAA